jgi:hypothetical protein
MKKYIRLITVLFLIIWCSVGCRRINVSQSEFSFDQLKLNFDTIKVSVEGNKDTVELDEEKSKVLYNSIKGISFIQESKHEDLNGFSYSVTFFNKDKEEDSFLIINKNIIEYKDIRYKVAAGEINLDDFNQLFEKTFKAVVLEAGSALLVSADKSSDEYKSSDKIAVGTQNTGFYNMEGEKIEPGSLKAGDLIEILYNGVIMESYPAQITSSKIKVMDTTLTEGYLALIQDIYSEDEGLNVDIELAVFDLTEAKNLSDIEKESLLLKFQEQNGIPVREGTYDQLVEEGLIDKNNVYFEKGILITMKNPIYDEKQKEITCGISKWRSGTGAVGSNSVTARLYKKEWTITKQGLWIS